MANQSSLYNPIYEELGVRTILQACGTKTFYSGPRLDEEVLQAMYQAAQSSVDIIELNRKCGQYIAGITHAEAGMVTSGAGSGIVLSIAACMTGNHSAKAKQLPDTSGMKNELIMQKIHRGHYSHIYTHAGARIIEVGDLVSCTEEDLEYAITEKTAAINFLFGPKIYQTGLSLETVSGIAKRHHLPLIVDAAAMLPPRSNLHRFIDMGADLVTFSGGKVIKGPQNSGLLFGRKDLIEAAFLNASPNNHIGRPHKLSKETIVGLYVALKRFMEQDEQVLYAQCREKIDRMLPALMQLDQTLNFSIEHDFQEFSIPVLLIHSKRPDFNLQPLVAMLKKHEPGVYLEYHKRSKALVVDVFTLEKEEPEMVAAIVAQLLKTETGKL